MYLRIEQSRCLQYITKTTYGKVLGQFSICISYNVTYRGVIYISQICKVLTNVQGHCARCGRARKWERPINLTAAPRREGDSVTKKKHKERERGEERRVGRCHFVPLSLFHRKRKLDVTGSGRRTIFFKATSISYW